MLKNIRKHKMLYVFITLVLAVGISSCGTLIYPDRIGQDRGRIDPAVVVMDGLFVFIVVVPGLLAFIIDFATGAIYLPDTVFSRNDSGGMVLKRSAIIDVRNGHQVDNDQITAVIEKQHYTPLDPDLKDLTPWKRKP